jgi:hypothetical protein
MATENRWGAPRVMAELLKLVIIDERTVSRIFPRAFLHDRIRQWKPSC